MRAMSPVTVDYPHSLTNDTIPLTSSTGTGRPLSPADTRLSYDQQKQQARKVTIDDPYSNQPVMFSMVDVIQPSQKYGSPTRTNRQDIPMDSMSTNTRYTDKDNHTYKQTTAPHKIGRPSWERGNDISDLHMQPSSPLTQQQQPSQPGNQIEHDWLWQSPDRRNA